MQWLALGNRASLARMLRTRSPECWAEWQAVPAEEEVPEAEPS
jgi:hypothetical protein